MPINGQHGLQFSFRFNRDHCCLVQHDRPIKTQVRRDRNHQEVRQTRPQQRTARRHRIGGRAGGCGDDQTVGRVGGHIIIINKKAEPDYSRLAAAPDHHIIERRHLRDALAVALEARI